MSANEQFMVRALMLAGQAQAAGEVPVGAVVVLADEIIGEGYNQPISARDPTAHAEIVAIRNACARIGNYRLVNASLYVTIEPCSMCAGALVHARIARLYFGAREARAGAVGSTIDVLKNASLNHRVEVEGGLLEAEASKLMTEFFRARRGQEN